MKKGFLKNTDAPFWLIAFGIIILLTLPTLIQDGMFMDGMLYTCVSHNLSKGIGTFWFPVFSPSWMTQFFLEQPPLAYGIQSLFFRIMGDSMYVERVYIFVTMSLTAYLIYRLWRRIHQGENELMKIGWFPLLIWITIPSSSWAYSNNIMENTMCLFSLGAILFVFKALESDETRPLLLILSGLMLFLATFSKGIPGLFPVTVPLLHWLIFRKKPISGILLSTFIMLAVPIIIYFVLLQFPQSKESLTYYFTQRLMGRIQNDPTVGNRFFIINRLFQELIPLLIMTSLFTFISVYKKLNLHISPHSKYSVFFLLVGLAASLPLMVTHVQRGFYLVPSFPYFALGFSIFLYPLIMSWKNKILSIPKNYKILFILSMVIFLFSVSFTATKKGKFSRDREMLHDVYSIGKVIPENSKIMTTQEISESFILPCYFIRYFNISLYIDTPQEYYLADKKTGFSNSDYEKLNIETVLYDVYKRK